MNRGKLICFSGIDGSGKSTLSTALLNSYRKKGISVKYVYGRYRPLFTRPLKYLGKILFYQNENINEDYRNYTSSKRGAIQRHQLMSKMYQKILLYEYFLQLIFKLYIPLYIRKKNIICDRYIFDTIITDLAIDFNYSKGDIEKRLLKLFRFYPIPDILFLIDVPEEIAYSRKNDTPSIEYLKERRAIYLQIGKKYNATVIDGLLPLDTLKERIAKDVKVVFDE